MRDGGKYLGRPTVMNEETLKKLRDAYLADCSDEEACLLAEISPKTLYTYQTSNPNYLETKALLRNNIGLRAKRKIFSAVSENSADARWYLERRRSDEYGTKQSFDIVNKVDDQTLIERLKSLAIHGLLDADDKSGEPEQVPVSTDPNQEVLS